MGALSARLSRSGGLVAGWLRKAENKAKAQHSWGLGLAELGNIVEEMYAFAKFLREHLSQILFSVPKTCLK